MGEKIDGYLGVVGAGTPALQAVVNDIIIKRRALYANKAEAANAALDEYALTAGCQPSWRPVRAKSARRPMGTGRRGAGAPQRDARCP